MSVGIGLTIPYALSVSALTPQGMSLDLGPVVGGYLGLLLLSSTFLALGLLASALTRNQIIAFIIGLVMCFFFFFIDKVAILMPASFASICEFLSVDVHFSNIARGVIDTRDILFYVSLTFVSLMLTVFSLRRRRN
jgi:ABC-2 type transport system permease protein